MSLAELKTDSDKANALVNVLIDQATNGSPDEGDFLALRSHFLARSELEPLIPRWLIPLRSLGQYWSFIQAKFPTYRERREFLWREFGPLVGHLEVPHLSPIEGDVLQCLKSFETEEMERMWKIMATRSKTDPEGAITAARNLIESVLKHILDDRSIVYDHESMELSELYKAVAKELDLSPEQHQEPIFRQILGGCSGIVSGLGSMRNKLGDAHGKGRSRAKPSARHARLAVNIASTMALFLAETHAHKSIKTV